MCKLALCRRHKDTKLIKTYHNIFNEYFDSVKLFLMLSRDVGCLVVVSFPFFCISETILSLHTDLMQNSLLSKSF